MKVIVCEGRDFDDYVFLQGKLDGLGVTSLVEGGAFGADRLARNWAEERGIPVLTYFADWSKYGKAAGPIRNQQMLGEDPDLVVVFPGGKGTADMVKKAKQKGTEVYVTY